MVRAARWSLAGLAACALLIGGTVATDARAPTVFAAQACNPHYAGTCIPQGVFDADCAGGGGDGPFFVQEKGFHVIGSDEFGLDPNNNGLGCDESTQPVAAVATTATTRAAGPAAGGTPATSPLPKTGSRTDDELAVAALLVLWGVVFLMLANSRRKLRME